MACNCVSRVTLTQLNREILSPFGSLQPIYRSCAGLVGRWNALMRFPTNVEVVLITSYVRGPLTWGNAFGFVYPTMPLGSDGRTTPRPPTSYARPGINQAHDVQWSTRCSVTKQWVDAARGGCPSFVKIYVSCCACETVPVDHSPFTRFDCNRNLERRSNGTGNNPLRREVFRHHEDGHFSGILVWQHQSAGGSLTCIALLLGRVGLGERYPFGMPFSDLRGKDPHS